MNGGKVTTNEIMAFLKDTVATKEDLKSFATKEDLKSFATKEDLAKLESKMATKEDLAVLKSELIDAMDDKNAELREELVGLGLGVRPFPGAKSR